MDCMELLETIEDNSIHLILTDPPYIISKDTNFSNGEAKGKDTDRFRITMDFGEWDTDENNVDLNKVIKEFYRVLVDGGTCIIWYDLWKITNLHNMMEQNNFKQMRFIEWIKTNPVPLNSKTNYLTNSREVAIVGVKKSNPTFNSEYDNGVYYYPIEHTNDRFHPTQKPLDLFYDLIVKHTHPHEKVLDCFSGGGTTSVACHILSREFIGCEINKEYYEKSMRRLKEYKSQLRLI